MLLFEYISDAHGNCMHEVHAGMHAIYVAAWMYITTCIHACMYRLYMQDGTVLIDQNSVLYA
jgi:hypothetical protein